MTISLILIIIAAVLAFLAIIGVASRVDLTAIGLLLVCIALIVRGGGL